VPLRFYIKNYFIFIRIQLFELFEDFEKHEEELKKKHDLSDDDIKEIVAQVVLRLAGAWSYIYYHLAKKIVGRLGWDEGKELIEKAIIDYGEEQGRLPPEQG
jgi:hypothetical protein